MRKRNSQRSQQFFCISSFPLFGSFVQDYFATERSESKLLSWSFMKCFKPRQHDGRTFLGICFNFLFDIFPSAIHSVVLPLDDAWPTTRFYANTEALKRRRRSNFQA